jgi:endonuclease YncB( thermonuclease family)
MAFSFPQFREPMPIDTQRSWTATFDSYDQRNDDVYYVVTIREGGTDVARFMVQVGLYWAGNDWTGPGFIKRLHQELHKVAVTGKTNTSYTGTMVPIP